MITENLVDQPFLDKYCVGYDEKTLPASAPANGHYKAYILGQGSDGVAKTPEWASTITGIPVERIVQLAREIGSAKPAYISQGWGLMAVTLVRVKAHMKSRLNVCQRWTTRCKPAFPCLCGPMRLNVARK